MGNNLDRATRAPALLTRLAQMFLRLQANEKTALCYSAHSRFDTKMATLGISKSQILRMYEQNRYVLFGCAKQHDLRGLNSTPTIKKFWGYRGIFQNPPKSLLNYLLLAKSQFMKKAASIMLAAFALFSCF